MKIRFAVLTLLAALPFLCSCDKSLPEVAEIEEIAGHVTAIVFIERHKSNAHMINSVTKREEIDQIIKGIAIGEELPTTRGRFAKQVVFLRGKEEYFTISLKHHLLDNSYSLRYRAKQYKTTKETYDLLAGYFAARKG